ncbi:hypothetical protein FMC13_00070 [Salmonella enterica subsp. enterica serovar Enteritidis]|nr:hypothetical protein [Salmonella enterica subsp. enterica serovar Enteritidis]
MLRSRLSRRIAEIKRSFSPESDTAFELLLEELASDRYVLVLDAAMRKEVIAFTKRWVYLYSPPQQYSRGATIRDWITKFSVTFIHDLFIPENMLRLWRELRSEETPSLMGFTMDLTTHVRRTVFSTDDDISMLVDHLAESFAWIHESDHKLVDGIARDLFAVDEQFFTELPTVDDIQDMLRANTWIIPLLYLHTVTVEELEEIGELVFKQTKEYEKKIKTSPDMQMLTGEAGEQQ